MTIVEFLNARLAEDESAAHAASPGTGGPERARADVGAKRGIVEGYNETYRECMDTLNNGAQSASEEDGAWSALHAWRRALEHLAAVYAAHPDYDLSWKR
ncbi:DUF6221 family protein [Streptomonospora litoralis]|uniref:Uncharacterized protein n=1 Tax=Streptomonospora litoralis TaxID=2498135 RepID=A0A4P6Q9Q4_9ACTN|nr:DUF6221 family protein [Streptomonospora litoralis]QBI56381.1 hypothetical protein EKD16_23140 [Streptomonospora litoralis]